MAAAPIPQKEMLSVLNLAGLLSATALVSGPPPSVLARAVPTNFWLLQHDLEDLSDAVSLCTQCCACESAEALEQSLRDITSTPTTAVEIEPLIDDTCAPKVVQWGNGQAAENIGRSWPTLLPLPGAVLAQVHEFAFDEGGTGALVWEAAVAQAIWLARNEELVRGQHVLELGAGVGLCGIAAALVGAESATLTDIAEERASARLAGGSASACSTAELLNNLDRNIHLNGVEAEARALDWEACLEDGYEPSATYPVVIGSDLVYEGFAVRALAAAVVAHTSPGGAAYLMSAKNRFDAASGELLPLLEASGSVTTEPYHVRNSLGRTELVLTVFRKGRRARRDECRSLSTS